MAKKKSKPSNPPTSVGYEGTVNLKWKRGNTIIKEKTIHNIGTKNLFLNIARAMYSVESFNTPKFLLVTKSSVDPAFNIDIDPTDELTRVHLDGRGLSVDSSAQAATISWTASVRGALENINGFGLTATSNKGYDDIFAYIKLLQPEDVDSGNTLIVEWSMKFANQTVTQN